MEKINDKAVKIDTVLIISHGSNEGIGDSSPSGFYISSDELEKMDSMDIASLLLLSCLTGEKGIYGSFASKMAYKTYGAPVLASQGIEQNLGYIQWYYDNGTGWRIFTEKDGVIDMQETGKKWMSLKTMLNKLVDIKSELCK